MDLVIVESPTKAKTISRFLKKGFTVESSFGHIRDLPKSKMGVDVENNFEPTYVVPTKAKKRVAELKKLAKKADNIYLATDEDREGEAIAWHLRELLGVKAPFKRITFHEITKDAILQAMESPRDLDMNRVDAQQARRILDRLVGYELSPFLWNKVYRGLSAGRVQSVVVRLVVEREREIEAFNAQEYWTVEAQFKHSGTEFIGKLSKIAGEKVGKLDIADEKMAKEIVKNTEKAEFIIEKVELKDRQRKPSAPFRTSTLQQEANSRLGFSAKQTMVLAQQLYEGVEIDGESTGLITYMRTDSLSISKKFLAEAADYIKKELGSEYADQKTYATTAKGAQEAHEAIRPTDPTLTPDRMRSFLDPKQHKIYSLIWNRAMASQMSNAKIKATSADITAGKYTFRATGSQIAFPGWLALYPDRMNENLLPELVEGEAVDCSGVNAQQHFTEPPARYSEAAIVKELEEKGIGRPSTYAPTISTVQDRGYVRKEDRRLFPEDIGFLVTDLLVEHFPNIVDYEFTAKMEEQLDTIAESGADWHKVIGDFYGPFHKNLEHKDKTLKKEDIMQEREIGKDPDSGKTIYARLGRFGPFVQLGEWSEEDKKARKNKPKSASLVHGMTIDRLTVEQAQWLLIIPRNVGKYTDGNDIIADEGRFGPYLKAGELTASLGPDGNPREITLEEAIAKLDEAAARKKKMATPISELGKDPKSGGDIQVRHGRYGPYITDGETNVSVSKKLGIEPEEVTLKLAIELLEKKRKAPKRNWGNKKKR